MHCELAFLSRVADLKCALSVFTYLLQKEMGTAESRRRWEAERVRVRRELQMAEARMEYAELFGQNLEADNDLGDWRIE